MIYSLFVNSTVCLSLPVRWLITMKSSIFSVICQGPIHGQSCPSLPFLINTHRWRSVSLFCWWLHVCVTDFSHVILPRPVIHSLFSEQMCVCSPLPVLLMAWASVHKILITRPSSRTHCLCFAVYLLLNDWVTAEWIHGVCEQHFHSNLLSWWWLTL